MGMEVDDLQFRGEPHPSRLIYGPPLFRQLPTKLNPSGHTEYLRLATNPHLSLRDCLHGEIYGNFVLISQYFFKEKKTQNDDKEDNDDNMPYSTDSYFHPLVFVFVSCIS